MSRLQDYEVLQILGGGKFGTCFKVKNKLTQKSFVWKAIDCGDMIGEKKQLLIAEINLLKKFNHPHIVQYFNHIINKETETLYIIMECCDGGNLGQWIKKCQLEKCHFEEEFIWRALYQLSKAVQGCHLHKQKIVVLHRDIKPTNVFLDSIGNIKLGDFGMAKALSDPTASETLPNDLTDTTFYMSIEAIRNEKNKYKTDIWSLGCLIYELVALESPLRGNHLHPTIKKQLAGHSRLIASVYTHDLEKIIRFMLATDHGYRPTVDVILHHPTVLTNLVHTKSCMPELIPDKSKSTDQAVYDFGDNNNTTHVLCRDVFVTSSPKRKLHTTDYSSEPEQMSESKRSTPIAIKASSDFMARRYNNPEEIAKEVFNQAFKLRLQAIKDRESDLYQREKEMKQREQLLVRRERHVKERPSTAASSRPRHRRTSVTAASRKSSDKLRDPKAMFRCPVDMHDASYVSIENDVFIAPTTAKLNPDRLYRPKTFEKKVSFHRSPNKLKSYDIENVPPAPHTSEVLGAEKIKQSSSAARQKTTTAQQTDRTKRKSFFSIFGLNLAHLRKNAGASQPIVATTTKAKCKNSVIEVERNKVAADDLPVGDLADGVANKWTEETKRTAFEMLAIMNAADGINDSQSTIVESVVVDDKIVRHDRKRQSMIVVRR